MACCRSAAVPPQCIWVRFGFGFYCEINLIIVSKTEYTIWFLNGSLVAVFILFSYENMVKERNGKGGWFIANRTGNFGKIDSDENTEIANEYLM